jgi:excisionase family DNA binding protein
MCERLLLKVGEAAKLLGLGRSKTYELIQRGALKSLKVDGARRVRIDDVHEFIERLRQAEIEP